MAHQSKTSKEQSSPASLQPKSERVPLNTPFWMPPEWAPHARTYVSWPVQASMCQPQTVARVTAGYAAMIAAIAEFEPVTVLVNEGESASVAACVAEARACASQGASSLMDTHAVDFLTIPHNDSWLRDNGPTFVRTKTGSLAGLNWRFNAWGGKYAPWDLDDAVAPAILSASGIAQVDVPLVMEGGSFHTDGEGTLLTTTQCLLNPNRNPGMARDEITRQLATHLGIDKILWLGHGLDGDETDGHIDNMACFAAPGKVLVQVCRDRQDLNFAVSEAALTVLGQEKDAKGRALAVVTIPQPPKRMGPDGRLTLSYLNFYFVNGGIILPVFGGDADDTDREAVRILSETFPERRIRTIDGMAIVTEGGNVHCATQQMPQLSVT